MIPLKMTVRTSRFSGLLQDFGNYRNPLLSRSCLLTHICVATRRKASSRRAGVSLSIRSCAVILKSSNFADTGSLCWITVGLIMGTRMWYAFWDADQDDDAAFEHRLDSVVREIGDRGKLILPEAVPPLREPNPAPAPAPKRAPAAAPPAVTPAQPAPSKPPLAAVTTPQRIFSPSTQPSPASVLEHQPLQLGGGGGLAELTAFICEQQRMQLEREEKLEAQRREIDAKLEMQRREAEARQAQLAREMETKLEAQRQLAREMEAKLAPKPAVSDEQLLALQSRIEALHKAQLLSDDELYALEDISADYIDFKSSVGGVVTGEMAQGTETARKLLKLVALSEGMAADGAFARQARRKYAV